MSTARLIDQNYVKTGKVRIIAKNFPVHGLPTQQAAEAALCAADQGRFWEYHDRLMESLLTGQPAASSVEGLKQAASDLGLDVTTFGSCLDGGKYTQRVQDEATEAQVLGVTATPTFFVNDVKIVGAQPYSVFEQAIERALAGS